MILFVTKHHYVQDADENNNNDNKDIKGSPNCAKSIPIHHLRHDLCKQHQPFRSLYPWACGKIIRNFFYLPTLLNFPYAVPIPVCNCWIKRNYDGSKYCRKMLSTDPESTIQTNDCLFSFTSFNRTWRIRWMERAISIVSSILGNLSLDNYSPVNTV